MIKTNCRNSRDNHNTLYDLSSLHDKYDTIKMRSNLIHVLHISALSLSRNTSFNLQVFPRYSNNKSVFGLSTIIYPTDSHLEWNIGQSVGWDIVDDMNDIAKMLFHYYNSVSMKVI